VAKMTSAQEAQYALDFGIARSDLSEDARLDYDRLAEERARAALQAARLRAAMQAPPWWADGKRTSPPPPSVGVALRAAGLTKRYGRTVALDGLDLEVGAGEVHAFLGPNGAGKTTTIRILLGLLRKDSGDVSLLGGDPWRDAVRLHRRLAYVPGDVTLWPSLTGGEIIDLLGRLRGGLDARRRAVLTERFDLDTSKKARAYSRGNRQKVALVAALASNAELLLLDEPSAGLDPLMEAEFRECIRNDRRDGRTILLSSHLLAEAEALADRVTIIRDGRTVQTGTISELRHLTRDSIDADLVRPTGLDDLPGVHGLVIEGTHVRCEVERDALNAVLSRLTAAGIRSLTCRPPTLEELFLRHYSANSAGRSAA
jgi:ABC-2 type transport system ATP-binding protein